MKVKVQTHVDIYIEEQYVLWKGEKFETWREKTLPNKFYSVRAQPILTDQIVITDFKRPASGTLDLKMSFTDDQYIDKITSSIQDTTITDSAALLTTIITKTGSGASVYNPNRTNTPSARYQWKTRTVAYQRFDINAPDYESQVEEFVSEHLNSCNRCGISPSYDQVGFVPVATP